MEQPRIVYRDGPFVRPTLAATVKGIPNPLEEVGMWSGVLREITRDHVEPAVDSYDLITAYGKLSRVRFELLAPTDAANLVLEAGSVIEARMPAILDEALAVPEPDAWIKDAEAFARSYESDLEEWTPEGRRVAAISLIEALDDAQVVQRVAAYASGDTLQGPCLMQCLTWVAEHAHLFLPASVWVQGVAMGLRPSLDKSLMFGCTAEKFVALLEAFLAAEQELKFTGQEPLTPKQLRALAERFRRR